MSIDKRELIDELASTLNKKYKGEKIAYNLVEDEDSPTNVDEWISTGSTTLDLAISNRLDGGYPVGRIIEIAGWEQSGKSLLAAHAVLSTQRKGGIAVYIDTENRTSMEFWRAIGINVEEVVYTTVDTMERVFQVMESIITKVRASNSKEKRLVTIVVDSVAAASTEPEKDDDFDKGGWNTDKAIIMSKALRKMTGMIGRERVLCIFTNQLREKMGVMFGDNTITPGGKALQFHATTRLRLRSIGKIMDEDNDQQIGAKTKVKVHKNTVGPPHREAEFEIYFDRGIDDYASWFETGKKYNLITVRGGWCYIDKVDLETGEVLTDEPIAFRSKDFKNLLEEDPELRENLRERIADNLIMKYRHHEDIDYENVSVVSEDEERESDE